jgi:hypothetical protein
MMTIVDRYQQETASSKNVLGCLIVGRLLWTRRNLDPHSYPTAMPCFDQINGKKKVNSSINNSSE